MWHYYMFNRGTFLQHYHKRSNAETTFSMIKGKFGEVVRAKMPVAQVNEVLCKVLCTTSAASFKAYTSWGLSRRFGASRKRDLEK
jgi:hypothetical protein